MTLLRLDSATRLKRYFHMEHALTVAAGAWVVHAHSLDAKAALARLAWECSLAADALRTRVFELRYPERDLEVDAGAGQLHAFRALTGAPDAGSLAGCLIAGALPVLIHELRGYLAGADPLADGPTYRVLEPAIADHERQLRELADIAPGEGAGDAAWIERMQAALTDPGAPPSDLPAGPYEIPDRPGRDPRYFACSFYWPDNVDPSYPYGDGVRLQVRTAVSHINEVWAVDTAGVILQAFSDELGWEFVRDAARWLYDESRHMAMGRRRFESWGVPPEEVPLGAYIYEAAAGEDPLYRLGMLAYFETRNIGRKAERAQEFGRTGATEQQRDMEFDWADEAIHAGYGRRWIRAALEARGAPAGDWRSVVTRCEELVAARVAAATPEETAAIHSQAERLLARCEELLGGGA